jgi:heme-degrading monooxygenase HmoA
MFVRHVSMRLKNGNEAEFNRIIEREVIPLLKRQKGFRDEIVLTNPGATEVAGISFWEQKEDAEAYNRENYAEVQKLLAKVMDGAPLVKTYEVAHSSVHKIAARAATA